jgi:hypothetical protein
MFRPQAAGQPASGRPVQVTAAAVLAFVVGGLSLLGALLLLVTGGSLAFLGGFGALVIVFALLSAVVGAAFLYSGLLAFQGRNAQFLAVVAGVSLALQVVSLISTFGVSGILSILVSGAILFLLLQPQSRTWFRGRGVASF